MEKLRRFAKRLLGANEKVVFALMVGVLIWRVVQIVYTPPPPPPAPPPPRIPIDTEGQAPMKSSRQDAERFATVSVARWRVPGTQQRVTEDEPDDASLPNITCEGTEPVGPNLWAKIKTDQRSELVRVGSYFAKRRAKLDEIDTNGKKIVFTWMLTGKQYERQIAG